MKKNIELKIIGGYILLFLVIIFFIKSYFYPDLLSEHNFINWDAGHYNSIRKTGYHGFLLAFFPFFPMLWKLFSLSIYGVVLMNVLIYFTAFYFLIKPLKLKALELFLFLSIPSAIFFYLPYSEAVFFACSVILLLGIKKDKLPMILLGLFLCVLTRPSFTVLIPSLLILEFFGVTRKEKIYQRILLYIIVSLTGLAVVGFIQYCYTNKWFEFFEVQKGWGNHLQVPNFPLTSWGGNMIVRLDGIAFAIGLVSGVFLLLNILKIKINKNSIIPNDVLFSLAYLGGMTLTVFLFRGGSLFSLNRFIFATPFILIAVNFFLKSDFIISYKHLLILFFIMLLFWLMFGSYVHIQAFLKYVLISVYMLLFLAFKTQNLLISKISTLLFILINLIFQVLFFTRFLLTEENIGWIG